MERRAVSFDLDGVVIYRPPVQLKATRDKFISRTRIDLPPSSIPVLDRTPHNGHLEHVSYFFHALRFVYPEARRILLNLQDLQDIDIYGNTGRPNQPEWIDMTKGSLRRGQTLDYFTDIFFKPQRVSTTVSKIEAVGRLRTLYSRVFHLDDNPANALPMAATFPDVQVVLVKDWSTRLLMQGVNKDDFPNLHIVNNLTEARQYLPH